MSQEIIIEQNKQQTELYNHIKLLVKKYNETQLKINPKESQKLILNKHVYGCPCIKCRYDYEEQNYHYIQSSSLYSNIFNQDRNLY